MKPSTKQFKLAVFSKTNSNVNPPEDLQELSLLDWWIDPQEEKTTIYVRHMDKNSYHAITCKRDPQASIEMERGCLYWLVN